MFLSLFYEQTQMIVLNQYDLGKLSDFENQKTSTLTCEVDSFLQEIKLISVFRLK